MGQALSNYVNFEKRGFIIKGIFDQDASLVGTKIRDVVVSDMDSLEQFVENNEYFSLSFFEEEYKSDLSYLGSHSGKDEDKVSKTKLTPVFNDKAAYFNEANMVLICRKLYKQDIKEENFIDKSLIEDNYPLKDFHTMYIGLIEEVLVKE